MALPSKKEKDPQERSRSTPANPSISKIESYLEKLLEIQKNEFKLKIERWKAESHQLENSKEIAMQVALESERLKHERLRERDRQKFVLKKYYTTAFLLSFFAFFAGLCLMTYLGHGELVSTAFLSVTSAVTGGLLVQLAMNIKKQVDTNKK